MKRRMLSWGLVLSLFLTLLPMKTMATEGSFSEDGHLTAEAEQCTCGAQPDAAGAIIHAEGCSLVSEEESSSDKEETATGTEATTPGTEATTPETEATTPETEEPTPLTPPVLIYEPLDEWNSSDMVLTVEGVWDSYAWESCSYGVWSGWAGDGPSLTLSKEDFTSYGFRCTVTRGEQSVTSEVFAYDPSALERPTPMANGLSDDQLYGSSEYIEFGKRLPNSTFFNIKGLDQGYEIQTTYADAGYRTAISVNGGTKRSVFYTGEPSSVGNSLTAETSLEIVYGGRYVKVTYEVTNNGSTTQNFQIGSSADVMIDNNDHAKVVGVKSSTGKYTGLSMSGSPKNSYQFSLVAPDCDTLWYGYYSKAFINIFTDLFNKDTPYSKDSGMAWSWSDTVAPGQTWSRYVLIGAGELPAAPGTPSLSNEFPVLKVGEEFSISGTVDLGSNPPDTVHVSINGKEYEARVNEDGSFTVTGTLPEDTPAGETTLTYWGTTDEGGISEIQSNPVTIVAAPFVHLSTNSVTVTEGDTGLDEAWLRDFIQSYSDPVNISPNTIDTNTPGKKIVTYTVEKEGFTPATATLIVTVLPQPAMLTQTSVSGTGPFTLSSTMTYTGGLSYKETGFVYGALQNPTLALCDDQVTTSTVVNGKGGTISACVDSSKLAYGVTYYARAYAIAEDNTVIYANQSTGFGLGIPSYGTFSVTYTGTSGNQTTFTITRSGGIAGEQTVYYRTVNGSAIGGTHFTHVADHVIFGEGETQKTVIIQENSATAPYNSNAATAYSNANRTYSFEIYRVTGGATIDKSLNSATQTMTVTDSYHVSASLFNEYQSSKPSAATTRGDYDDDKLGWTDDGKYYAAASSTVNFAALLPQQDYWKTVAQELWYRFSMKAKEINGGYQHIQFVLGSSIDLSFYPYDGAYRKRGTETTIKNLNATENTALYAATFEHGGGGDANTTAADYYFPKESGNNPSNCNMKEIYQSSAYAKDHLVIASSVDGTLDVGDMNLTVGFGGSGTGNDKWESNLETHSFKLSDTTEPQLLGVAPMAGGSYLPGDSITVALVFNEIVDRAKSADIGQVQIETNWGTFTYSGGADTNVLYFTGKVEHGDEGNLTVTSIINASYIKDMADDTGTDTGSQVDGGNTDATLGTGANAPTVTVSEISNSNGTLTGTVSGTPTDIKLEYVWSQSSATPDSGWRVVANGSTVTTKQTSGTWYLHARATNGDGVTVDTHKSINLDSGSGGTVQLPSLTLTVDNTDWASTRVIAIDKSPSDAAVMVKTPGSTSETPVPDGTYSATANGTYTFTLRSNDEIITKMVAVSKIDRTGPAVEIINLANLSHTQAVTLTVRVSDGESGIDSVIGTWSNGSSSYTANISGGTNGVYTTTSPDESGTWTLNITATDWVGNSGTGTSSLYTINATRPGLTVTKQSESASGVVYYYAVAPNNNSGITVILPDNSTTTELTGYFTIAEPGNYAIAVTDDAGHFVSQDLRVEPPQGGTLDGVAPDVRLSIEDENWTKGPVTVNVEVYDAGSAGKELTAFGGAEEIILTESLIDEGSFTGSFSVSANDTYTVTCTDAAGNPGSGAIEINNMDTTAPSIAVSGNPEDWTPNNATIILTVTDDQSGVSNVEVKKGGSTVVVTKTDDGYTFSATENGTYIVTATDGVDNTAHQEVNVSKIDKSTPELNVTGGMKSAPSLVLTVSASSAGNSPVTVTVKKDGASLGAVDNGSYPVTAAGTYVFTAVTGAGKTTEQTIVVHSVSLETDVHLVANGGTVTKPADPTKDGYDFDGWYNGDTPWSFDQTVTKNLTLTAHWSLGSFLVTLSADRADAVYSGGQPVITLTADARHGADVTFTYEWYQDNQKLDGESSNTLELSAVAHTGTYTVTVTASTNGQSEVADSNAVAVTIHKAAPVVTAWPAAQNITYGNSLGESTLTGGAADIAGSFAWKDSSITPSSGSQSGTVVFSPEDADNYNAVEQAVLITVAKRILIPHVVSIGDKTYDGDPYTEGVIRLEGAVSGEMPTASGMFAFADANAGAAKAVTVTITLDGSWGNNYQLSASTLESTAAIAPKTVGLVWQGYEDLVYSGQPVSVTAVATGLVTGDECAVIVEGGSAVDAGDYIAMATGLDNSNYQLPATGTTQVYTIAQAAGSASVSMADWTYGETASVPVPQSATHGTDNVTYRYTGTTTGGADYDSSTVPTQAGQYTVTATFATTDNYDTVTAEAKFIVARKSIFATWLGLSQVYGDEGSVEVLLSGIVGSDDLKANVSGGGTDAGTYELTAQLTGAAAHNYTLQNSEAALTVQPKPVIFTVTDNIKQETGSGLTAQVSPSDPNCTYTIAYKKNRTHVAAPTDAGSYEIWVKITNPNYRHTDGSTEMQVGTLTITQAPPVMYTAFFAGGEGTEGTTPAAQAAVAGGQITLPANPFIKKNYLFTGWTANGDTRLYQPGDCFTMPARNVTFTAQWQAVFTVGGTVTEKTDGADYTVENAVVSLWLGANKIDEVSTNEYGAYHFDNLIPGIYNLVVTKDVRTVTSKVELTENKACDATLPKGTTNSIVKVTPGSPDIVVGKLDTVFDYPDDTVYTAEDQETVQEGGKVEFIFTAEEKQKIDVSEDIQKIQAVSGNSNLALVMDYKLGKEVFGSDGTLATSKAITQANVLLEVLLPLPTELQGKDRYSVYRVHSNTAQKLTMTPSSTLGEYFTVSSDKTSLTLYVKCFSTYAIGYTESSGSNSGGGTSTSVYPPSIEEQEHGSVTISPKNPGKGDQVTITPAPDDGYAVDTVIVTDPNGNAVAVTPNDDGTYTFVQPSGNVTITVTFRPLTSVSDCPRDNNCPMAPFTDADRAAWYHDGIHYCVEHGLMMGTSQTTFAPNTATTRGMIVTILWRLAGSPIVSSPMDYDDVTAEDWYGEAVRWADSAGVVSGYGNGKFGPNDPITREQMATMLWRYAGSPKAEGSLSSFADGAQTSRWAQPAMIWATERGLFAGVGNDRLEPQEQATRAQTATILTQFSQSMTE